MIQDDSNDIYKYELRVKYLIKGSSTIVETKVTIKTAATSEFIIERLATEFIKEIESNFDLIISVRDYSSDSMVLFTKII